MSGGHRLLEAVNLCRSFRAGSEEIQAIKNVNLEVLAGQFIVVVGRSGSGKTTLLNLMAGLDKPTSGSVLLEERDLSELSQAEMVEVRRHKIGFVFQSFGLLPLLSALENIELPLRISGVPWKERQRRAEEALDMVRLAGRANHRPYEMSGGEQQRVAIARAIVHRPSLLLADEPTGELDSVNAKSIFGLFKETVLDQGISVVAATHDSTLVAMADEVKELHDGSLAEHTQEADRHRD